MSVRHWLLRAVPHSGGSTSLALNGIPLAPSLSRGPNSTDLRPLLLSGLTLALVLGCSTRTASSVANLAGTQDLVLVDELGADWVQLADGYEVDDGKGGTKLQLDGMPNRYVFITSSDTNELRVLNLYQPQIVGRQFVRAPNPLESLSIPVLERPSMLAVDEGVNVRGRRVTGSYVYAARPGNAQFSVVGTSPSEFRSISKEPLPAPGPLTAMAAYMGSALTSLPALSSLYLATYASGRAAVFRLTVPSNPETLREALRSTPVGRLPLPVEPIFDAPDEAVVALVVMPPLAGRAVDGQPFCDTGECLAVATRRESGREGRAFLLDPKTLKAVAIAFPGPVRAFSTVGRGARLFAILDEERCGGPACGGVVAASMEEATGSAGFSVALDFSGRPMQPISVGDSLPMGLALGEKAVLRQTAELWDGGSAEPAAAFALQEYAMLGVVSSSRGELTFFDGISGAPIDYDARRSTISGAALRVPGALADGGQAFFDADGGFLGSVESAQVRVSISSAPEGSGWRTQPWRGVEVHSPDGGTAEGVPDAPFRFDISDGYFMSQNIVVAYEGQIPGLINLPTRDADGRLLQVPAGGAESRAVLGDGVAFFAMQQSDAGAVSIVCGEAQVAGILPGHVEVDEIPSGCDNRVSYTVRAGGAKPMVVAADLEGYLGRGAPGVSLTYDRRYLTRPAGFGQPRVALQMVMGDSLPKKRGAHYTFLLEGRQQLFRLTLDTAKNGCAAQLPGRLAIAQLPTYVDRQGLTFPWEVIGVLPSANGVVEFDVGRALLGALGIADGAICYQ